MQAGKLAPRVLLVGTCLTLAAKVARCLHDAGITPFVLGVGQLRPLALLPECRAFVLWDDTDRAHNQPSASLSGLNETCRQHAIDIVVPADFETTLFVAENRSKIASAVGLLPDPRTLCDLHDKWRLVERMRRLGLRHPRSVLARNVQDLEAHGLRYPILSKPLHGSFGVGIKTYRSQEDLAAAARAGIQEEWPVLVQEFIEGADVDLSFIAKDGRLLAHSVFRHGGYSRSFVEAPELKEAVEVLLADANYTGVGHIDSRLGANGYHILEINPRFWGSLLYERRAGINYPELFVRVGLSMPVPTQRAKLATVWPSLRDVLAGQVLTRTQSLFLLAETIRDHWLLAQ